jgi:DNA phosphorothioation-dependent restriction protein DptG
MAKTCIECGKEIKEETDSPYCERCDEMLDRQFETIEDNIIVYKELMDSEIKILNKFEKEDITDLYKRAYDSFKEEGEFTEEQAKILSFIKKTFNLNENEIGKDKIVEYREGSHIKKIEKDKCPDCGKDIKEDFNLCPYCGFRLKN